MYTLEEEKKQYTPLRIQCILMPQIIPLLIVTLVCMCYEEATPHDVRHHHICIDL